MKSQQRSHPQVVGPLAPLAGELLDELKAQGYSPSWSVVQLRLLAGLSCWLEDKELGGEGITAGVLEEFSAARIAAGGPSSRVLLPGGGLMRFLRSHGCLAVDVVPVPGPAEELLGRFRRHLTVERGLQLGTINNYERAARVLSSPAFSGLLKAGVDTSVIALWLGHERTETTQIYLHADLGIKERALARTTPADVRAGRYRPPDPLLAFLESL